MSIKLMALIFDADIPAINYQTPSGKMRKLSPPTATLALLALADHANDEGEGAYPSLATLKRKTKLSEGALLNSLRALKAAGMIAKMGISKRGTSNYTLNMAAIIALVPPKTSPPSKAPSSPGEVPPPHQVRTNHPINHPLNTVCVEPPADRRNHPAVKEYARLTNLIPNAHQLIVLSSTVTNVPAWTATVEHWLGHDWSARNVTGMLSLMAAGGPDGCETCKRGRRTTANARGTTKEPAGFAGIRAYMKSEGLDDSDSQN